MKFIYLSIALSALIAGNACAQEVIIKGTLRCMNNGVATSK